jgi:cell division protein FtsI/penicillin-binding protein 2/cell division protein FtsW (lipid II flippase)
MTAHPTRRGRDTAGIAFDVLALLAAGVLLTLGVLNLYDVGGSAVAGRQIVSLCVGLVLLLALRRLDSKYLPALGWTCYAAALVSLAAVPFVGLSAYGARRWLGVAGFTFQPSELAKLGMLIVLAGILGSEQAPWRRLALAVAVSLPPLALTALQPDLSTATLLAAILLVLLLAARLPLRLLLPSVGALLVLAPLSIELLRPYQLARIQAFVTGHGEDGPSWAVRQAHIALTSRGFAGHAQGPVHDLQQQYLPDRQTDLALASVVETWGMVAGLAAVLAAGVLVWRLALAAATPRSRTASLVAAGLAGLLGAECVVSVGGTLGVLPLAGVPFPLLGLGGTSAVVHLAAVGLVLGSRRDGARRRLWSGAPGRHTRPRLVRATAFGMSGVLAWYAGYAWHLEATQGAELRDAAQTQMTRCTRIPAPRGVITDRHGTPLATSTTLRTASGTGKVPAREYPYGPLLAPILGFVGVATPADTARVPGLPIGEFVGRSGIEQQYDALLRGVNGRRCEYVDPAGRRVADAGTVAPIPGQNLWLSLDLPLQKRMARELGTQIRRSGGDLGGAVALDPRTGQVLAMASSPSYDNEIYGPPVDPKALAKARSKRTLPMLEHTTQVSAPPGSVFKLVVAAADMAYGTIPANRVVPTGGSFTYGGHVFHNWMTLGPQDLGQALAWSNDVYFYKLALALGPDRIHRVGRALGVGEPTGIDLPGESAAYFGTPASVATRGGDWYAGSTVILGIGQGYVTATPLQVARWTAGVGTGRMVVPRLGLATSGSGTPFTVLPVPASSALAFAGTLGPVRRGLREAVTGGTAARLAALPVAAGGKTGSAQDPASPNGRADSWFTALAPLSNPTLVVTAFVRGGGHGASTAGPVVHETLAYFLSHQKQILASSHSK